MKLARFGIITEDKTDADAVSILIRCIVLAANAPPPAIKPYWANGCARMRQKAKSKMADMMESGCKAVVIIHDLDRNPENGQLNDEPVRRGELQEIPVPRGLLRHICIPVEEIEAWFWADEATVKLATHNNERARAHASPHLIPKPKERFEQLSRGANGKSRYNTNKNPELAAILNLATCEKRCPSFRGLAEFVRQVVA